MRQGELPTLQRRHVDASPCLLDKLPRELPALCTLLRELGLDLPLLHGGSLYSPCGISMQIAVRPLLQQPLHIRSLAQNIAALLEQNVAVTLTVRSIGAGDDSAAAYESFCRRLIDAGLQRSSLLGMCTADTSISMRAFAFISRCWLGSGPRYVLLGPDEMQHSPDSSVRKRIDRLWRYLWRYRGSQWEVRPAYGARVSAPCPLLSSETASGVLPQFGVQVPTGSAWLPMHLHLPRIADADGVVALETLDRVVQGCIDIGDRVLDRLQWSVGEQQQDATVNRRMAILVTGFGDLVGLQRRDPRNIEVLRWSLALVERIHAGIWFRSARLAQGAPLLPAIERANPVNADGDDAGSLDWGRRWRAAVERSAVRHRNLLVMSPYSVLPANGRNASAFADLLPVIRHADAWGFAALPQCGDFDSLQFKGFHRRAWAEIGRRHEASVVATRV